MNENNTLIPQPPRPDSRVRDHLANERTFLAWVRTALGLIGIGFVVTRMGVFLRHLSMVSESVPRHELRGSHEFLITGVIFLLLGIVICLGSGWAYHRSCRAIDAGQYEPLRHTVTALTVVVVLGSLAITGLVLWQLIISRPRFLHFTLNHYKNRPAMPIREPNRLANAVNRWKGGSTCPMIAMGACSIKNSKAVGGRVFWSSRRET
jgi:putative membrane protein